MNDKQRRRYERLARSRDYATTQNASFPASSVGGKALANINTRITEIEDLDAARNSSQRAFQHGTSSRRDTRKALRELLAAISRTAATAALDYPEFKDKFRRPRANFNDQNLLGLARSIATDASAPQFKARFIEYDMPADFLDRLNELIADFEQSINQQNTGKGGRRANSVAIDAALDAAEQDLERLDTAFRNKFSGDAAVLAAWESARRLQNAPKAAKTGKPEPK